MTEFRGVQKEKLIDSFTRAQNFLRGQNLGEATAEALQKIDAADAVGKITAAKDDKDLAFQLKRTGVLSLLSHFGKVFSAHAACEAAAGDGHEMQDLYRDLMSWSAFFDETAPINPRLDKEAGAHVIMRVTTHIAGAEASTLQEERLDTKVEELKEGDPDLSEYLEKAVPIYRLFGETGDADGVNELMQATTNVQDGSVLDALTGISGLPEEHALARPAMQKYKVTISNKTGDSEPLSGDDWLGHLLEIKKSMLTAMLPFFDTGQFGKIDMLPTSREKDTFNISFYATVPAARVAAAKLQPFQCTLLDEKGVAVPPAVISPPQGPSANRTSPNP